MSSHATENESDSREGTNPAPTTNTSPLSRGYLDPVLPSSDPIHPTNTTGRSSPSPSPAEPPPEDPFLNIQHGSASYRAALAIPEAPPKKQSPRRRLDGALDLDPSDILPKRTRAGNLSIASASTSAQAGPTQPSDTPASSRPVFRVNLYIRNGLRDPQRARTSTTALTSDPSPTGLSLASNTPTSSRSVSKRQNTTNPSLHTPKRAKTATTASIPTPTPASLSQPPDPAAFPKLEPKERYTTPPDLRERELSHEEKRIGAITTPSFKTEWSRPSSPAASTTGPNHRSLNLTPRPPRFHNTPEPPSFPEIMASSDKEPESLNYFDTGNALLDWHRNLADSAESNDCPPEQLSRYHAEAIASREALEREKVMTETAEREKCRKAERRANVDLYSYLAREKREEEREEEERAREMEERDLEEEEIHALERQWEVE